MKFEHGFLLDHHPSDPRIGHREQKEKSHDRTAAEVEELDAEGEGQEDAGREYIDGPFRRSCSLSPNAVISFSSSMYAFDSLTKFFDFDNDLGFSGKQ